MSRFRVNFLLVPGIAALLMISGCGGAAGSGGGGGSTPSPTATISATPTTITLGSSTILTFSTTNATSCSISGIASAVNCGTNMAVTVSPTATTTYVLTAIGEGGSTTVPATVVVNPAPPTATLTATATTITLGQTITFAVTTTGATSCAGSGSFAGTEPCSGTITVTPTATGTFTYTITATGPGGTSAPASITVTVNPVPVAVTSVTVVANPTSISNVGQTTTCIATVQGAGAFTSAVSWAASGGTITSTGVFTPTAGFVGNATCTASSLQTGYTTVAGAATIAVIAAKPLITSISLPTMYCDAECGILGNIAINGSGFQSTDTISSNPSGFVGGIQAVTPTQLLIAIPMDTPHTSPGFITFTITSPDGSSSSSIAIAYLGNQNLLTLSPGGELYLLDEGNGVLRQYKADGTADGTTKVGSIDSGLAYDEKTSLLVLNQRNGATGTLYAVGKEAIGNGYDAVAVATRNGFGCLTQAYEINYLSCVDLTLPAANTLSLTSTSAVGNQPWSFAIGLFGTETDAFVFSRDGTPTLWKVNISGGLLSTASQSIPGITPVKTLQASNAFAGGWQVAVFDSGPASGTVAVLSTADNSLAFLNTSTMAIVKQVTLPGVPFRIAADKTNGNLIVAYPDQANVRTTFAAVNPTTGVVTPLTATSAVLAVGFQVSADGKIMYSCDRSECDVLANK